MKKIVGDVFVEESLSIDEFEDTFILNQKYENLLGICIDSEKTKELVSVKVTDKNSNKSWCDMFYHLQNMIGIKTPNYNKYNSLEKLLGYFPRFLPKELLKGSVVTFKSVRYNAVIELTIR